jgi:hypothetical protein
MRTAKVVALALMCTAFGGVAGSKLALFHQHQELERNKSLVRRMHVEVWSDPTMEKAAKAARELTHQISYFTIGRAPFKRSEAPLFISALLFASPVRVRGRPELLRNRGRGTQHVMSETEKTEQL